jgi:hypothetical protein
MLSVIDLYLTQSGNAIIRQPGPLLIFIQQQCVMLSTTDDVDKRIELD